MHKLLISLILMSLFPFSSIADVGTVEIDTGEIDTGEINTGEINTAANEANINPESEPANEMHSQIHSQVITVPDYISAPTSTYGALAQLIENDIESFSRVKITKIQFLKSQGSIMDLRGNPIYNLTLQAFVKDQEEVFTCQMKVIAWLEDFFIDGCESENYVVRKLLIINFIELGIENINKPSKTKL